MPTLFILQTFLPSRLRDCSPSAPSIRFSALSHSLFVGRASVCAWLALRHCKALGHTRLRHPCLFMNALLVSHPCETLGVHFRHPCLACPSRCTKPCHSHSHLKRTSLPRPAPNSPKKAQKSAIRVNCGFFIFNSQHSSKWCPVVKHNALTAPTANTATAFSALSLENCQHPCLPCQREVD